MTTTRTGNLTLLSHDRSEIYGEFAEAEWAIERPASDVTNHIISAVATEGSMETLRRIDMEGIEHVTYQFEGEDGVWTGLARLLAMEHADAPASAIVRIECLEDPVAA